VGVDVGVAVGTVEGVDSHIYPINSVERKALLDALKDLVV